MTTKATLVILAAGLGSRYGGMKQVDGLGPDGDAIMAYSAYDAVCAGFEKIVLIVKPEILSAVQEICGDKISRLRTQAGEPVEVIYVFQDFSSVPSWYHVPDTRTKPFGTVHAALCAKNVVDGSFAMINADDYYGAESFAMMLKALEILPEKGQGTMLGYRLDNTVSPVGTVTRGICQHEDGRLKAVKETYKIQLMADGRIFDMESPEAPVELPPDASVSMSFWGFTPWIFREMEQYFEEFLKKIPAGNITAECLLPVMVDKLMTQGVLDVTIQPNNAQWFGITCPADRPAVQAAFKALHDAGLYPEQLFPN